MKCIHSKAHFCIGILILLLLTLSLVAFSQTVTNTIKGRVLDGQVQFALPGATVVLEGSHPVVGTTTDVDGYFELQSVPVGRVALRISYVGYEDKLIEVMLSSSFALNMEVPLKELATGLDEVEIKDEYAKEQALNNMALISARSISLDEAQRFAGSFEDFSRLAASFAGVSSSSIDNNEVIIRGNPAKGILWRLEGVEVPVPNHLAHAFNGGGVVSMFSPFMMSNSDFFTGAYPAEYGNVLSGVFDINFRTGNPDKAKYGLQIGSYGVEAAAEGPFRKGGRSTYLANYRLSTFSILQNIMPIETGLPDYTDLSFNLSFPTKKAGVFSLWSMSGYGKIEHKPADGPADWETSFDNIQYKLTYGMTATGLNHRIILSKKSLLSSAVSFSGYTNTNVSGQYDTTLNLAPVADISEENFTLRMKSTLNHKFGTKHTNRTGIILNGIGYNYENLANSDPAIQDTLDFRMNAQGNTFILQAFSQSLVQIGKKVTMNAGLHFLYFGLNGNFSVEPRLGFKWQAATKHSLGAAYGKHSRVEPLRIYLTEQYQNGKNVLVNKELEITKAHHFVLSYDWSISREMRFKLEPYVQLLYDVPVTPDSSFSMINYQNDMYIQEKLTNTGTGINYGIDLTFERFMKNGLYYMVTASIYASRYKGGDGIERNTRLNQNYALNLLGGKEWKVKENNFFSVNGKFTVLGGIRYTPPDQEASQAATAVVYDMSRLYENRWNTNFLVDISLNYRINRPKVSHNFILQAKNLTAQSDLIGFSYNYVDNYAQPMEMAIVLPYLSYKITF
jgi:hypothetical protein